MKTLDCKFGTVIKSVVRYHFSLQFRVYKKLQSLLLYYCEKSDFYTSESQLQWLSSAKVSTTEISDHKIIHENYISILPLFTRNSDQKRKAKLKIRPKKNCLLLCYCTSKPPKFLSLLMSFSHPKFREDLHTFHHHPKRKSIKLCTVHSRLL